MVGLPIEWVVCFREDDLYQFENILMLGKICLAILIIMMI